MSAAIYGAIGAVAAALVTFALTRRVQLNDRRARRLDSIEESIRRIGDDLYDGFEQLARAVPGFRFRPRSGRR